MLRRTVVLGVASVAVLLASCRTQEVINTESYVQGLDESMLKDCILKGCAKQKWKAEVVKPGLIVAEFKKDEYIACVDIIYSADGFRIVKNDKTNMMTPDGKKVHSKYNQWVLSLQKAIEDIAEVTNLPPEAKK